MLCRGLRDVEALRDGCEIGERPPRGNRGRFVADDLLQQVDRLRPLALRRERERGAVVLDHRCFVFGIDDRISRRWSSFAEQRGQGPAKMLERLRRVGRLRKILTFPWIGTQVVQLFARRADVLELSVRHRDELAPAELAAAVARFAVDDCA